MTPNDLARAADRADHFTTLAEQTHRLWLETETGTHDSTAAWNLYERALMDEDAALRTFFRAWMLSHDRPSQTLQRIALSVAECMSRVRAHSVAWAEATCEEVSLRHWRARTDARARETPALRSLVQAWREQKTHGQFATATQRRLDRRPK